MFYIYSLKTLLDVLDTKFLEGGSPNMVHTDFEDFRVFFILLIILMKELLQMSLNF